MKHGMWMAVAVLASASTATSSVEAFGLPTGGWFQLKDLDQAGQTQEEIVDHPMAFLSRQFAETSQVLEDFMKRVVKKPSWPPFGRSVAQPEPLHIVVVDDEPLLAVNTKVAEEGQEATAAATPETKPNGAMPCVLCKRFVQMVKMAIQDDLDKVQEVRDIIGDICDSMDPSSMCHTFLKRYDDVVEWLKHDTDPDVVCKNLNMCTKPPANKVDKLQDKPCFFCDTVTTMLEIALKEKPEQIGEVRQYADMLCGLLGPDSKCHEYVDKFDQVIDELKQGKLPHQICRDLKYCTKVEVNAEVQVADKVALRSISTRRHYDQEADALDQHDDHACFYCTHITDAIRYVQENAPNQLETLRTVLKYGCKVTPSDCRCNVMVENFDTIVADVKKGQDSAKICQQLKMCKKQSAELASHVDLFEPLHGYDPANKKCFYCETFTTLLEILLKQDPQDVDMVRMYADMICGMLGDDNECHAYVKNLDTILDDLRAGQHARQICQELEYCSKPHAHWTDLVASKSSKMSRQEVAKLQQDLTEAFSAKKKVGDLTPCFLCEQATVIVREAVKQHLADLEEIRDVLDSACDAFASTNPCHQYVDRFDLIVDDLAKGKSPKAICVDLEICDAPSQAAVVPLVETSAADAVGNSTCALCDTVVAILEMAMQQRPDQVGELRELAGIICELMPEGDLCHDQLKTFDQVVELLKQHKQKPHEICQTIHYCASAAVQSTELNAKILTNWDPKLRTTKCGVCKQNALLLTALATKQDGVETFLKSFRAVCRLIPQSQECEVLIQHQDAVVDALKHGLGVDAICDRIHQCNGEEESEEQEQVAFDVGCLLCEYTGQMVEYAKGNKDEIRLMKSALESICVILPPAAKCDSLSSQFDELVKQVDGGQQVHKVCQNLHLCPAGHGKRMDAQQKQIVDEMRKPLPKTPALKDLLAYQ